jgi:hypothetical protein
MRPSLWIPVAMKCDREMRDKWVYDDVHILMVIISIIVEGQKMTEDVVYKIPNGCYESLLPVVGGGGHPPRGAGREDR